jgi:hypothetical protein
LSALIAAHNPPVSVVVSNMAIVVSLAVSGVALLGSMSSSLAAVDSHAMMPSVSEVARAA